jgi:hypothetical protein
VKAGDREHVEMTQIRPIGLCLTGFLLLPWAASPPRLELDHVYIVVSPGGKQEIAALQSAGLTIGPPRQHDGEGTTSVAAFFENAYLELMWLDSTVSVTPEHAASVQRFRQAADWRVSRHSPFGLGVRRLPGEDQAFGFPIVREGAPWIGPDAAYEILNQPADTRAADLFVLPRAAAVPQWIGRMRERSPELLRHRGGGRAITLVRIHGPVDQQPSTLPLLHPAGIEMRTASEPLLEILIDGGHGTSRKDLRPILPIVVVR